jgi:hypothetical protein
LDSVFKLAILGKRLGTPHLNTTHIHYQVNVSTLGIGHRTFNFLLKLRVPQAILLKKLWLRRAGIRTHDPMVDSPTS